MSTPSNVLLAEFGGALIVEEGGLTAADAMELRNQIDTAHALIADLEDALVTARENVIYASDYASIQAAIDAAEMPGAPKVVQVGPSTHDIDATLVVPASVTLRGGGSRITTIRAGASFPAAPVIQMGRSNQNIQHGVMLEDLTISGNMRPGTIGVFTDNAHEPSAIKRCIISECMEKQIYIDSGLTPGHYSNHMLIEDCEIFAPGSMQTGATVDIRKAGNPVTLRRSTINTYASSGTPEVALYVDDAPVIIDGCHLEIHNVGIEAHAGTGSKGRITVLSLTGHPSMGRMIELHGDVRGVIMNLQGLGATSGIWDMQANNGIGAEIADDVEFHVIGNRGQKIVRTITGPTSSWDPGNFLRIPEDVLLLDVTAGSMWFELPNAPYNRGKELTIKRIGTGTYNLDVAGYDSQTIDGVAAKRLTGTGTAITVVSDGANWWITQQHGTVNNTF